MAGPLGAALVVGRLIADQIAMNAGGGCEQQLAVTVDGDRCWFKWSVEIGPIEYLPQQTASRIEDADIILLAIDHVDTALPVDGQIGRLDQRLAGFERRWIRNLLL